MAEKFDHLEEHLEKFVENIRQLGIIVSDFQPSSQAGLNQKLNFIVTGLQDIDKCRQQLHDITVPLEVFEYIDQGRNPQLYTKECLERALAKNEQVKGKIDTMKAHPGSEHWVITLMAKMSEQSRGSWPISPCVLSCRDWMPLKEEGREHLHQGRVTLVLSLVTEIL
uniref:Mediator of RNA polymerase II transcription subunit 10 n=1 Tax=Molossus molossus TaxID=27622 RepID=A0A7J8J043_MOLMO|nr:mediator complex subunit 10 [Molossus molossus]